jgi:uncharacterized protein (TIGR02246 family)
MKKMIFFFTALCALSIVACNDAAKSESSTVSNKDSSTVFNIADAKAAIDADNTQFEEDVRKGDSAALANHYHSDAQFLLPNAEPIGKANMAAAMGGMLRMGIKDLKLTTTDLTGNDDMLLETGTYEMFADKNTSIDKGKFVVGWKKENGKWKIYRDMINTSMPAVHAK